jgi:hypothetical protein
MGSGPIAAKHRSAEHIMNDGQRLARLAVSEEGFGFDPDTGAGFSLNALAVRVVKALAAGEDETQIAADLSRRGQVPFAQARADLRDFMEQLRAARLLG